VVFNNCGLSRHIRELYQHQCVAVIDVIRRKRSKESDDTCNDKKRRECELQFGKEFMQWACEHCEEDKKKKK
jgi:hypothetical protein